jgi:hypothetical protein
MDKSSEPPKAIRPHHPHGRAESDSALRTQCARYMSRLGDCPSGVTIGSYASSLPPPRGTSGEGNLNKTRLLPLNLLGMVGTRSTASPYLPEVRDAVERVPTLCESSIAIRRRRGIIQA